MVLPGPEARSLGVSSVLVHSGFVMRWCTSPTRCHCSRGRAAWSRVSTASTGRLPGAAHKESSGRDMMKCRREAHRQECRRGYHTTRCATLIDLSPIFERRGQVDFPAKISRRHKSQAEIHGAHCQELQRFLAVWRERRSTIDTRSSE